MAAGSLTRYTPYGQTASGGGGPSDHTFTGQRSFVDAVGLMDYGARFYDPALGRFASADSIVPEPGNPQALNRYAYVLGNPLRYVDPSGHDPLDQAWGLEFMAQNGRSPTDADRFNKLYSLLFKGSGPDGEWTSSDWAEYASHRDDYVQGKAWRNGSIGDDDFGGRLETLASYYLRDERDQYVSAVGLFWAGMAYGQRFNAVWAVAWGPRDGSYYIESNAGWNQLFLEKEGHNQSHHWAGLFYLGYYYPDVDQSPYTVLNIPALVNFVREVDIEHTPQKCSFAINNPDVFLGNIAILHGAALRFSLLSHADTGRLVKATLMVSP